MAALQEILSRLRRTGFDRIRADGRIHRRVRGCINTEHISKHQLDLYAGKLGGVCSGKLRKGGRRIPAPELSHFGAGNRLAGQSKAC